MILEDGSKSTVSVMQLESREEGSTRPVTAAEKFKRRGHLPAAFLVPDGAITFAERALFEAGFEVIVLRKDLLGREAFSKAFDLLYSAGFVILASAEGLDADAKRQLEGVNADRTVFDVSDAAGEISNRELVSRVLTFADTLRLGVRAERGN